MTPPVLNTSKNPTLAGINEDAPAPIGAVGTLVSALVDFASPAGQVDNITDVDTGALLGIAITATNTTNGTWFYSTDGGANWQDLGTVSTNGAALGCRRQYAALLSTKSGLQRHRSPMPSRFGPGTKPAARTASWPTRPSTVPLRPSRPLPTPLRSWSMTRLCSTTAVT